MSISKALVRQPSQTALATALSDIDEKADAYKDAARATSTGTAYAYHWGIFDAWCTGLGLPSFPADPATVKRYVTVLASERKWLPPSVRVACSAIRARHFDASVYDPTSHPEVRRALAGIRRVHGRAAKKKAALAVAQLAAMVRSCADDAAGKRDKAILLLGYAGAFRRAALVRLDVDDLDLHNGAMFVHIRRDKTDQEGKGRTIAVPFGEHPETCPVRAVLAWLESRKEGNPPSSGPLFVRFRSGRRAQGDGPVKPAKVTSKRLGAAKVAEIVKARAVAAGIDPADLAGHSLRSGLATAAARAGKKLHRIMAQTGHAKPETVMGYIRDAEAADEDNAARGIGL